MRALEFVTEKKKRKKKSRMAAYGPGPYGGYGYAVGYSGDGGSGGDGGVGESVKNGTNDYLWHGSKSRNDVLIPRQAKDTGGAEGSNKNAVYATADAKVAIAMGLTTPGSETGMFPDDPQMVLFKGGIRKGQMVYLHKVPKDLFIQHNSREWYSKPDVKEITPIEIKEVPVDKYLNLIRKATLKDLELRAKYTKKDVAENLNEASSDEAWELVGQPVPEIQQFVKQMGYSNDEESVEKITAIIDAAPDTQIPAASIPKLKNLANKGNDIQTLKAVQQISGKPDAEQQYTRLMQTRDAGEGRNRDVSGYLQYVKSGNYDPPVLLKISTGIYVIGGRTRLYAALALGVPAKVKIISANNFKQRVEENFADGKKPGRNESTELKKSIPSGIYFDVDDVSINSTFRGLGVGSLLYKLLVTCIDRLNPKVKGILSPNNNRLSTAGNVSKIYSQLGGTIGIKGERDSYDLLPIKKHITLEVEPQPGAQISAYKSKDIDISFLVEEAGPYRILLNVFDHKTMKNVGSISATVAYWNSETETLNVGEISENFADGKVKGKSRPGRVKRSGASCSGSVTDLRKRAKNASGEKAKMYHWCANMKSGRNK